MSLAWLPALNAALNATSAVLLVAGYRCIRSGRIRAHTACMLGACLVSTLFLASYLVYHARVGSVRFLGVGWVRPVYFAVLLSHTVLAVVIVPLILRTLLLAARRRFAEHTALARWTLPLWLYVSVTGVLVYWMLYHLAVPVAEACPGCKEALFDPGELPQRLAAAKGYAASIGLMLVVPLGLVGGLTAVIVRSSRRQRGDRPRG